MDVLALYATDSKAEEKGRWFENGDTEWLIARNGNRQYADMLQQLYTAHKATLEQKDTPEQRAAANARFEQITIQVMSRTILLGWRGKTVVDTVTGESTVGKVMYGTEELEFNPVNAAKFLAIKDFRNWISAKADDFKNFLLAQKEADEKNSETTSTGSSNGEVA